MASLDVTAPAWGATLALIGVLFAVDLLLAGRPSHAAELREAAARSLFEGRA